MGSKAEYFHAAIRENDKIKAQLILEEGVNIDCIYYGMTPLFIAISKGYTDLAVWLINNGSKVTEQRVQGSTLLDEAVTRDQVQVVHHLIRKGVNVNQRFKSGHTALTHAVSKRLTFMVQALLEGGAAVNEVNDLGEGAVYLASRSGCHGVLERLLAVDGVELNMPCGADGLTPLIAATVHDHLHTAKLLLKAGCDRDVKDNGGWTALWHAVTDEHQGLARAIIQAGADIDITDQDGRTLMQVALENEDTDIVELLQKRTT